MLFSSLNINAKAKHLPRQARDKHRENSQQGSLSCSFHLLNYGPGQSEAEPSVFPESAFSAVWEGYLTPDCTVEGAMFQLKARGHMQYAMYLDGKLVLNGTESGGDPPASSYSTPVDITQGKKMKFKFEYTQPDNTGGHPAFSLRWSLQGAHALQVRKKKRHIFFEWFPYVCPEPVLVN